VLIKTVIPIAIIVSLSKL